MHTDTGSAAPGTRPPARLRAPAIVVFVSFVDVFALLPTVAPHVTALGAGAAGVGLAVGAYSATNIPANVVGGILVDRVGRRRIVLLGLVLAAAAVASYALATSVATFVAVRALHGMAGGVLVPAVFAAAGDAARTGGAGRAFGRLGALIGTAAVLAPASAGLLRQVLGTDAVFLVVAGVLLGGALVAWRGIHDTAPSARPVTVASRRTGDAARSRLGGLMRSSSLRRALAATATLTAAVGVLAGFLPGRAEALGAPPSTVGGLFTVYAVVAAGLMLSPLAGRVDRSGGDGIAAAGLLTLTASLVTLSVADGLGAVVLGAALFGAGYGLVFPAVTGATSIASTPAIRGRAFGLFNAAFSVGLALGPPIVGVAVERVPGLDPFLPVAGLTAVVGVLLAARRRPTPVGGPA